MPVHLPFLPKKATFEQAKAWLEATTGEQWPLERILETSPSIGVWLRPNSATTPDELRVVFEGRTEGFYAPFCFSGDLAAMLVDRTVVMTHTRTVSGGLIRMEPGLTFEMSDLVFDASEINELAQALQQKDIVRGMPANYTPPALTLEAWLTTGRTTITVWEAIEIVLREATYPPTIDFMQSVSTGEFSIGGISDGKGLARTHALEDFTSFCAANEVHPINPYQRWAKDYDGSEAKGFYEVTAAEFLKFAEAYRITEDPVNAFFDEAKARDAARTEEREVTGWHFLDEAAADITRQRGLDESLAESLLERMKDAVTGGLLEACDAAHKLPVPRGTPGRITQMVRREIVNKWLAKTPAGYLWEGEQEAHAAQQEAEKGTQTTTVEAPSTGLTTPQIAEAFSFVVRLRAKMGDVKNHKWLLPARLTKGKQPTPATWCPLKMADLLVSKRYANEQDVNAAFLKPALRCWRDKWQEAKRERNAFGL